MWYAGSQVVAVIPVIGKSDSMAGDEMINLKTDILRQAANKFFNFSGG